MVVDIDFTFSVASSPLHQIYISRDFLYLVSGVLELQGKARPVLHTLFERPAKRMDVNCRMVSDRRWQRRDKAVLLLKKNHRDLN